MYLQPYYVFSTAFKTAKVLLLVLMAIGMSHLALAQDTEQAPIETVEEIIVYGDQSLHSLRRAVFKAEENFFAIFSALNDDDEYDIRCFYETSSGTRRRRHVCRANFVTNATSAEAAAGSRYPITPAAAVIQRMKNRLGQKMEVLVIVHGELFAALTEYTDARDIFVSERKRR